MQHDKNILIIAERDNDISTLTGILHDTEIEIISIKKPEEIKQYQKVKQNYLAILCLPLSTIEFEEAIQSCCNPKNLSILLYTEEIGSKEIAKYLKLGVRDIVFKDNTEKLNETVKNYFIKKDEKEYTQDELLVKLKRYRGKVEELENRLEESETLTEELTKVQKKFSIFQEISPDGFCILKPVRDKENIVDFMCSYANPKAKELLQTEIIGSSILRDFAGRQASDVFDRFVEVLKDNGSYEDDFSYLILGKQYWFRETVKKFEDDIAITFHNITEKKEIELENERLLAEERKARIKLEETIRDLNRLKEEYKLMGDTIPFGTWKADSTGKIEYFSDSFLELIDMKQEEAYKYGWMEKLSGPVKDPMLEKWKRCLETGDDWESEHPIKDKSGKLNYVLAKGLPVKNKSGEIESWVGLNIDITDRKMLEEKLLEAHNELKEILERVSDSFLAVDSNWIIKYINENAKKGSNYRGEIVGKNFWEVFPGLLDTTLELHYRKAMQEQVQISFEYYGIISPNWYSVTLYPSNNGLTIYSQDITEKKKAQGDLQAALKEKEILIKEVHHRVKNNLQIISSLLNLQSNYIEDEKAVECFKDSQTRIRSMAIVHEQLYHSATLSMLDFNGYLNDLVSKILATYRFSNLIKIDISAEEIFVNLEVGINLGLIINELVLNSLKHGFKQKSEGTVEILVVRSESELLITVKDDGDGLPDGFDLETTDSFGMQLVSALIEQMHGKVKITESTGAQFDMRIPLKQKD